jgi:alpha-galactosidase
MGAHVSSSPHQQTLRQTPLSTRYNVASFGCLGYELDLKHLNRAEKREIRQQVSDYKIHRQTMQFGRFYRLDTRKDNKVHFQTVARDGRASVAGFFQTLAHASEGPDVLPLTGLEPNAAYAVETRPQMLPIRRFGHLINYLLPFPIHPEWFLFRLANRFFSLTDCVETFSGTGRLLMAGVPLHQQFLGTGYSKRIRMLGDFGSNLYWITKLP